MDSECCLLCETSDGLVYYAPSQKTTLTKWARRIWYRLESKAVLTLINLALT